MTPSYSRLAAHYESCLERFGDTPRGVDRTSRLQADLAHEAMIGVVRPSDSRPVRILDFGCGTAQMLDYVREKGIAGIEYEGLDVSESFLSVARAKYPDVPFHHRDVLADREPLPEFDYLVANGVFTEKLDLRFDEMWEFVQRVLVRLWPAAGIGMAFNFMSKHVDWEREDLFHLPFDTLAAFLKRELSRRYVFRSDYGLYEYTAYVYR